jgi:hypothetical protein
MELLGSLPLGAADPGMIAGASVDQLNFLQVSYPDKSTPCALVATRLMSASDTVAGMATIAELQAKGFAGEMREDSAKLNGIG